LPAGLGSIAAPRIADGVADLLKTLAPAGSRDSRHRNGFSSTNEVSIGRNYRLARGFCLAHSVGVEFGGEPNRFCDRAQPARCPRNLDAAGVDWPCRCASASEVQTSKPSSRSINASSMLYQSLLTAKLEITLAYMRPLAGHFPPTDGEMFGGRRSIMTKPVSGRGSYAGTERKYMISCVEKVSISVRLLIERP
jgi:hypothetical protein